MGVGFCDEDAYDAFVVDRDALFASAPYNGYWSLIRNRL